MIGGGYYYEVFTFKPIKVVQIYDYLTDSWSYGATLPLGMEAPGVVATSGVYAPKRIYVLGGSDAQSRDYTFVYDPLTDSWSNGTSMPFPRGRFGVAVVDDIVYAIGGSGRLSSGTPVGVNERYTPFGYRSPLPTVQIISPEQNKTYDANNVTLTVNVNKSFSELSYSLSEEANVTITGNTTLTGLSNGMHNVTVYAKDEFENIGASETITFTIEVPFPTALVATASLTAVAVVGVGLLVYFKKRKH